VTGASIVEDLIVDDGVASRGHRLAIFDERFHLAGCAIGNHKVYGNMVAIEFAGVWHPDETKIKARLRSGPPSLALDKNARKGEKKTAWNIGKCAGCGGDIQGGQVVEAGGKKYHKECFCCTQCSEPLAGVKQKKEEDGRVFCQPCWVELYAKTCFVCKQKIEGSAVRKGNTYRHPDCKPPAVKKSAPVKAGPKGAASKKPKGTSFEAAGNALGGLGMDYANF